MVLYFSGTGNSQYVALQIAKTLTDGQVVSINRFLKEGGEAAFQSSRPLVFVTPTYCWRMPRAVERWLLQTAFQGNKDAYFVLTCAGSVGNAAVYAKTLCEKKGLRFCGLAPVRMPENYLALFPTPGEEECRAIVEQAGPCIDALAEQIRAGECFAGQRVPLQERLESGPLNPLFYALFVRDKGFSASERCISCGKCAQRCPLNNIALAEGRPVWKGNCTHCMACIGGCPTRAIEYKAASKGRHRHYIMDDAFCRKEEGREI